jgi:hypothetical protein
VDFSHTCHKHCVQITGIDHFLVDASVVICLVISFKKFISEQEYIFGFFEDAVFLRGAIRREMFN